MVQTQWHEDYEKCVIENVRQFGWHIVGVNDDPASPPFAYSIGIYHTLKQPEIIIFGLGDFNSSSRIINVVGDEMKKGVKFEDWTESDKILDGYTCMFRHVDESFYPDYLGYAMWFYRPDAFPVLQCVWPDRQGHYPWQPEFSADMQSRQPVLARQQIWRFHEGKNLAVFTTRRVLDGSRPILYVSHDSEGDWQFLCETSPRTEDGRIVGLGEIVQQHPSVMEIADLPVGWQAIRDGIDEPWRRTKSDS